MPPCAAARVSGDSAQVGRSVGSPGQCSWTWRQIARLHRNPAGRARVGGVGHVRDGDAGRTHTGGCRGRLGPTTTLAGDQHSSFHGSLRTVGAIDHRDRTSPRFDRAGPIGTIGTGQSTRFERGPDAPAPAAQSDLGCRDHGSRTLSEHSGERTTLMRPSRPTRTMRWGSTWRRRDRVVDRSAQSGGGTTRALPGDGATIAHDARSHATVAGSKTRAH